MQSVAQGLLYDDDEDDQAADAPAAARGGSSSQQTVSLSELRQALLDADLRKLGSGCLPDDINRANSSSVKGPMVLQVRWWGSTREANSTVAVTAFAVLPLAVGVAVTQLQWSQQHTIRCLYSAVESNNMYVLYIACVAAAPTRVAPPPRRLCRRLM